jgi:RNA polymerase sigma-70 factor (ECF subfamily)
MNLDRVTSEQPANLSAAVLDWDRIYLELAPRVYNYVRFRTGSHRDAEDLTSRTFEKAWRARARYSEGRSGISTWLFRIAQNVCIDHLRARRAEVAFEETTAITDDTPERQVERGSDLARLAALTRECSERDRELLALKYGAVFTNREIAKLTGLSESNVGTLLHRLVQTLRSQW